MLAATIGTVDGVRLVGEDVVRQGTSVHSDGMDLVLGRDQYRVGLGVHLRPGIGLSVGPRAFGHPGQSGSLGWADPEIGVTLAYVPNQMLTATTPAAHLRSTRFTEAVYRAVRA